MDFRLKPKKIVEFANPEKGLRALAEQAPHAEAFAAAVFFARAGSARDLAVGNLLQVAPLWRQRFGRLSRSGGESDQLFSPSDSSGSDAGRRAARRSAGRSGAVVDAVCLVDGRAGNASRYSDLARVAARRSGSARSGASWRRCRRCWRSSAPASKAAWPA